MYAPIIADSGRLVKRFLTIQIQKWAKTPIFQQLITFLTHFILEISENRFENQQISYKIVTVHKNASNRFAFPEKCGIILNIESNEEDFHMYKNIEQQQKVILKDLVDEQPGQIAGIPKIMPQTQRNSRKQ